MSNLNGNIHRNYYLDATIDYQNYERFNNPYNVNLTDGSRTPSTVNQKKIISKYLINGIRGRRYHQIRLQAPLQWTSGLEAQQESPREKRIESGQRKSVPLQSIKPLQYNLKK